MIEKKKQIKMINGLFCSLVAWQPVLLSVCTKFASIFLSFVFICNNTLLYFFPFYVGWGFL